MDERAVLTKACVDNDFEALEEHDLARPDAWTTHREVYEFVEQYVAGYGVTPPLDIIVVRYPSFEPRYVPGDFSTVIDH